MPRAFAWLRNSVTVAHGFLSSMNAPRWLAASKGGEY
jgi:hypothetical protein